MSTDGRFLDRISSPCICLVARCLGHSLDAWRTGAYIRPVKFKFVTVNGKPSGVFKWPIRSNWDKSIPQPLEDLDRTTTEEYCSISY